MSRNRRQQRPTVVSIEITPGDWPSRSLDALEHLVPPQLMALFPDLGSWLLRSVRRDDFADSPIFAIERLNALPRPLEDADKDTLVGAVLTMSSSLQLGLAMLRERLPQEQSRDRLGEVLCPTLGHLLASLRTTMSSFDRDMSPPSSTISTPLSADDCSKTPRPPTTPVSDSPNSQHSPCPGSDVTADCEPPAPTRPPAACPPQHLQPFMEGFPPLSSLQDNSFRQRPTEAHDNHHSELVKALQAEMRVQAAIHVAVESLEFAEGQLKLVKEINGLHGGSKWPSCSSCGLPSIHP